MGPRDGTTNGFRLTSSRIATSPYLHSVVQAGVFNVPGRLTAARLGLPRELKIKTAAACLRACPLVAKEESQCRFSLSGACLYHAPGFKP